MRATPRNPRNWVDNRQIENFFIFEHGDACRCGPNAVGNRNRSSKMAWRRGLRLMPMSTLTMMSTTMMVTTLPMLITSRPEANWGRGLWRRECECGWWCETKRERRLSQWARSASSNSLSTHSYGIIEG